MNKIKFKYLGKRKDKHGLEKSYDKKILTEKKLKILEGKGWVKAKPKPKPKAKKKAKKKIEKSK